MDDAELRGRPTEDVLRFYRELRQQQPDYVGYSEPTLKRVVIAAVARLPGASVVDLGCGPNPVVLYALAKAGKTRFAGVDLSSDFCANAAEQGAKHGVTLETRCAPVHDTGLLGGTFDVAILTEVLEHVPDELERATVAEAFRLLAPGGRLVVSVPNARSIFARYMSWRRGGTDEHPQHLREYTPELLESLLVGGGFEIERGLTVPATDEAPWRARSAWLFDRLTFSPRWSLKAAFVARRPL